MTGAGAGAGSGVGGGLGNGAAADGGTARSGRPLLVVEDLAVSFGRGSRAVRAVRGVSFTLRAGEILALVGESGSGKSVTARSLVGLAGPEAAVRARRLELDGVDLTRLDRRGWRRLRGRKVGLVLQDALSSLDPLRRVGQEVAEGLRAHRLVPRSGVDARVLELLGEAGIPDPAVRARQYPHELSGGLRQRALIATALAGAPALLVADEPTTALDVTVQAQILDLLGQLRATGRAVLVISHDLAVVSRLADRVAVMRDGTIVETGPTGRVLGSPAHDYTRALLAAVPSARTRGSRLSAPPPADRRPDARPGGSGATTIPSTTTTPGATTAPAVGAAPAAGSDTAPVLEATGLGRRFRLPDGGWRQAVAEVSFTLREGEVVGLVGESGSGKTTLVRILLGLLAPDAGEVRLAGRPWTGVPEAARRPLRRNLQAVFQDPLGSFDPRMTVAALLGEALAVAGVARPDRRAAAAALLGQVGLSPDVLGRRPAQLSGGQRQRVAIARALAPRPRVLVCDEPVSALDVSVQAQVLDLLADLRRELGMAMLFVSHDLAVVHHVSDRVLVMRAGRIVESGDVDAVLTAPRHDHTRALIAAIPRLDTMPHPADRPSEPPPPRPPPPCRNSVFGGDSWWSRPSPGPERRAPPYSVDAMSWGTVELEPEVRNWLERLPTTQFATAAFYIDLIDLLADHGPLLGEPYSRQLDGKLRELRFHLEGQAVRVTYWLAPDRRIVLLAVFRKTRMRETVEISRARRAWKRCLAEAHTAIDEEGGGGDQARRLVAHT